MKYIYLNQYLQGINEKIGGYGGLPCSFLIQQARLELNRDRQTPGC